MRDYNRWSGNQIRKASKSRGDPADQFSAAALRGQWSRAVSQACSHGTVDMSDEEQRDAVLRKVPQEREAWDYEAQGPPLAIDIDTLGGACVRRAVSPRGNR